MALYRITARNSVDATGTGLDAFDQDGGSGPNFLFVTAGAFLRTSDSYIGARLDDPQPWNLFVAGSITSEQSYGVFLTSGGLSNVQVLRGGHIEGGADGIGLDGNVNIRNSGTIVGTGTGAFEGNGIGMFGAGVRTITNFGTITGTSYSIFDIGEFSVSKITNFGTLNGNVELGYGDDVLVNWGRINGSVYGGAQPSSGTANLRITNHGTINGDLWAGDGADILVNRGVITQSVLLGSDFSIDPGNNFTNSGRVGGYIECSGYGDDIIVNSGVIAGSVSFGFGDSTLRNTGTINGDLVCVLVGSDGNETIINLGTILGEINLGAGDDTYIGGNRIDDISDSIGADKYSLGGGNDRFVAYNRDAADGIDTVDGGAGIDTYYALSLFGQGSPFAPLTINLDKVAHGGASANTAVGFQVGPGDKIFNFENVVGNPDTDFIYGSAAINKLDGFFGDDFLWGFGGNDVLIGFAGADTLVGGAGRDHLYGGFEDGTADNDGDTFVFEKILDSGNTVATRDVIFGFVDSGDLIDLAAIDAKTTNGAADDTFVFIGTNVGFSRIAGELRAYFNTAGQVIEGDVNGDGRADFSIQVDDSSHSIVLDTFDFIL